MTLVLSLVLLGLGIAVLVSTFLKPESRVQEFPRFGAIPRWNPRILPAAVGVVILLGGVALLVLSRMETP
jgi:hypothetical protein